MNGEEKIDAKDFTTKVSQSSSSINLHIDAFKLGRMPGNVTINANNIVLNPNETFKKNYILMNIKYLLIFGFFMLLASCSSDENLEKKDAAEALVTETKNFLNGDFVLNTRVLMNGVNKTLLPKGCPTKVNFSWNKPNKNIFTIRLDEFTVGQMPLVITFACDAKIMQLTSWEKNEYKGDGWVKFQGVDGQLLINNETKNPVSKGSSVKGFYNVKTHEINFIIDFNMMNVSSECFLQIVDKSRTNNYEAEFKKFEEELEAYKKEHGL
ncbi:hypothetical protein FHS60_000839 [Alloprevotella rava]|nr:DUF4903 family protein [Alloprevotella rava]MBB3702381.1 hypothetical protein [Alloprevotella rava]